MKMPMLMMMLRLALNFTYMSLAAFDNFLLLLTMM